MLELLQQLGEKYKFNVATMDELAEFNHVDNLHGKKYRVLIADTLQCAEGVNFFAVRRMFLTDVPSSPSQLVQQVGRALRLYSHRGLADKDQTVTSALYVAALPSWMRPAHTYWASTAQKMPSSGRDLERLARRLASQLKRAGLGDMAKLKTAIDRHARGKTTLTCKDVSAFLEEHGLWEEARQLQHFEKKEAEAAKHDGTIELDEALSVTQAALSEVAVAAAPRPGKKKKDWRAATQARLQELGKIDVASASLKEIAPTLWEAVDGAPVPPDAGIVSEELELLLKDLKARRAQAASSSTAGSNSFVQALNALRSCTVEASSAKPETADELALRQLSLKTREFAPALSALRSVAVDRDIFGYLAEKLDEIDDEESDDGEPSEHEPLMQNLDEAAEASDNEGDDEPVPSQTNHRNEQPVLRLWTQEPTPEEQEMPSEDAGTQDNTGPQRKRIREKTSQTIGRRQNSGSKKTRVGTMLKRPAGAV